MDYKEIKSIMRKFKQKLEESKNEALKEIRNRGIISFIILLIIIGLIIIEAFRGK
jgi:hypothetical protein